MNNKKKWIIGCGTGLVLCLVCGIGFYVFYNQQPELKKRSFEFEYGNPIKLTKSALLDTDNKEIIQSIQLDMSKIKNENNKEYPPVGKYKIPVSFHTKFKEIKDTITIRVKDTKKPTVKEKVDTVEVQVGDTQYNFLQHFLAEDLSEIEYIDDLKEVDFDTPGEYPATIQIKDAHNNSVEVKFTVVIQEKPQEPIQPQELSTPQNQENTNNASGPSYVKGIMVVNKKHSLPQGYAPGENAEAGNKVRQLIADMQAQGFNISNSYSGYRDYNYQNTLYWNYVNSYGQAEADTFSARPGYSEHQTGLAFDLKHQDGTLVTAANEANWLANNAHRYGFIVRYQFGKEHITGYQAEPWHLRYIGNEATAIYQSGLTLEEYLGVPGGGY